MAKRDALRELQSRLAQRLSAVRTESARCSSTWLPAWAFHKLTLQTQKATRPQSLGSAKVKIDANDLILYRIHQD